MQDVVRELRERSMCPDFRKDGVPCLARDCDCERIERAAKEIERLREALYECARYLEEQVSASYWHIEQPFDANTQRRYDRDMARAHKFFAALREEE